MIPRIRPPRRLSIALLACVLAVPCVGIRAAGAADAKPKFDGQKLFSEKTCITCHAVNGPSFGVGPELTQVGWHRDPEWLRAWLTDPQKMKKDTLMPKMAWSCPEEMQAVIDYVLSCRKPIASADSADGSRLFAGYKCSACHSVAKRGGKPQFPDLAGVGKRRTAAWLDRWLTNPQLVRKGTWEPTFKLSACERGALVKYLASLK